MSRMWFRMVWVAVFAGAFGLVEASVVIYLRELYYPLGFSFPLIPMPVTHLGIELVREGATIVMLIAVGVLAGSRQWERFGFFLVAFGAWDILFYAWLRVATGWPTSLTEWDVLFLLPLPWIGPVYAPLTIAMLMIVLGAAVAYRVGSGQFFRPGILSWMLGGIATGTILFSFMVDTAATLHGAMPKPYHAELLAVGVAGYVGAFIVASRVRSSMR
jgi:hypothetical protein